MNEQHAYANEDSDDDGWGFYVILDVEHSFINVSSIRTYYTKTISALPTIEEGDEMIDDIHDYTNEKYKYHLQDTRYVYAVFMISCLYLWILLMN